MDKEQFDFCYIDPPYNTGQQFVYPDLFSATEEDGLWGRHLGWMEFMLPRLVASHGLLMDTGIMAISIDDYEYANLKLLMDAIFGEDNYIATLVIMRSKNGKGSKPHVAVNHEYVCL
jgi:adenine-specific DNA-methyltransferase